MAKKRGKKGNLNSDRKPPVHQFTDEERERGREKQLAEAHKDVPVEFPVHTFKDCEREDVLEFCLKELRSGTTYNDLRKKLGLGPTHIDFRWRKIRRILTDMILPANEEEAVLAGYSASQFMLKRMEQYLSKIENRVKTAAGDDNEAQFWRLELDAMRAILDKQEVRTDQYLKMKALQKKEKGRKGTTIIFQNNVRVPRPGEVAKDVTPLKDAAQIVGKLAELEEENGT